MDDDAFDSVTGISEEEHTANSNEAEIELHRDILREEAAARELRRIRISPSFRIGVHIITAIERPWRLLLLPITLPWLMFQQPRLNWTKSMLRQPGQRQRQRTNSDQED